MHGVTPGRNVHYVMFSGQHRAAIITGLAGGDSRINVVFFLNGPLADGEDRPEHMTRFVSDVPYDSTGNQPHSWHWIEPA